LVPAYDLLEDRCTIDVIITKFFFCVLKWRKVLRIKIIFSTIGKKIKSIVETLNRYDKHSLAGKRKIKPFSFLENGTEKFSSSPPSSETKPNTKLVGKNYWLTNPINKTFEIDSFNKFNFSQLQEILDTLIDVRKAKHQNTTS